MDSPSCAFGVGGGGVEGDGGREVGSDPGEGRDEGGLEDDDGGGAGDLNGSHYVYPS